MSLLSSVLTAVVTELEQPHRFNWRVETSPDGWQSHVNHAPSSMGDLAAIAIETVVDHMKRKGMSDTDARKAVTVVRLKKEEPPKVVAKAPTQPVAPAGATK